MTIDYRSDTVTKPTPAMLDAMMQAKVGDDVFGEDPTINELENLAAQMFGMEAGLFCASGTMTNQIAIKVHTQPGDEVICDELSHIYQYEGGGIAFNSGCSVHLVKGNRGRITADQVKTAINNVEDIHKPISKLVSLENTVNRAGGSCYDFSEIENIKSICVENDLQLHLDGARLFNALVSKNESAKQYGTVFNTISICLSKGLGTPVGSVLLGPAAFIKKARRVRKVFGGGMRQAGFLAAAGIYALKNNVERLSADHLHAQQIATALAKKDFVGTILEVETNIVIFEIKGRLTAEGFVFAMKEKNILMFAISPTQVRMVLHLDITESMVQQTIDAIEKL
jgi:threonine aldolase